MNVTDDTFFSGIRQFPAASYQLIDLRQPRHRREPERFWLHPFERGEEPVAGSQPPARIREVFTDAVRLRLRSDVPVGVLLSGGVDSSSIVGAIAEAGALENVTVLSVTSDDPLSNEEPFIDGMARHVQLRPQKVNVSSDPLTLLDRVEDACWFNDEPVASVSHLAHLRLMELARAQGIKVLLTGQGADEQLGGYNKFLYFWLLNLLKEGHGLRALKTLAEFARQGNTLYEFKWNEAIRYLRPSRLAEHTFIRPEHQQRDVIDIGSNGSYRRREWIDLTKTSVPLLLHYEDRMSMSQSVEVRVPFLDFRLVECLARVHPSEKFEGGWTKSIFRKAIGGLVPKEIQYRRDKKGFDVPENEWMRGAYRKPVTDVFNSSLLAESFGLVDAARLRALYTRFVAGHGFLNGRHFFRAFTFERFLRRLAEHLSARSTAPAPPDAARPLVPA